MKFDHHCPWVGNCIGKNNYRIFLVFISTLNIILIYTLIITITLIKMNNIECIKAELKDLNNDFRVDNKKKESDQLIFYCKITSKIFFY
jgi:hypothetical protein